jgi:hypothetical protein
MKKHSSFMTAFLVCFTRLISIPNWGQSFVETVGVYGTRTHAAGLAG